VDNWVGVTKKQVGETGSVLVLAWVSANTVQQRVLPSLHLGRRCLLLLLGLGCISNVGILSQISFSWPPLHDLTALCSVCTQPRMMSAFGSGPRRAIIWMGPKRAILICIGMLVVRLSLRAYFVGPSSPPHHAGWPHWPAAAAVSAYGEGDAEPPVSRRAVEAQASRSEPPVSRRTVEAQASRSDGRAGSPSVGAPIDDVYPGEEVTAILEGIRPWPGTPITPITRMKFRPGTLTMNSTVAFRRCYVDPQRYKLHFLSRGGNIGIEIADDHKLLYIMVTLEHMSCHVILSPLPSLSSPPHPTPTSHTHSPPAL
jgi:hypothetical protein